MNTPTPYQLLTHYRTRAALIWASCFAGPHNLDEVASMWEYSKGVVLHQYNLPQKMVEAGLLKIDKIEKKFAYYSSLFDRYFEILDEWNKRHPYHFFKEDNKPNLYEIFLTDKKTVLPILNDPGFRNAFFELKSVKEFANHNREEIGNLDRVVGMPVDAIVVLIQLKEYLKRIGSEPQNDREFATDKKTFTPLIVMNTMGHWQALGWNPRKYLPEAMKRLDLRSFNTISQRLDETSINADVLQKLDEHFTSQMKRLDFWIRLSSGKLRKTDFKKEKIVRTA